MNPKTKIIRETLLSYLGKTNKKHWESKGYLYLIITDERVAFKVTDSEKRSNFLQEMNSSVGPEPYRNP